MSIRPLANLALEDVQSIQDPVLITHLLVDLIGSHRRGQLSDEAYQDGFELLNQRLIDAPSASDAP